MTDLNSEMEIKSEIPDEDPDQKRARLPRRHTVQLKKICAKDERNASLKKVSVILQKSETDRTLAESQILNECTEAVEEVRLRWRKRIEAKRRLEEFEDNPEVLQEKCQVLAQAVAQSQYLVVYTGAGISTAAKIPDYRGPNGIWTRLQQGKDIGAHDLSLSEPTYTHMALAELYKRRILKYVVSQNCDGLHLRSGLPRTALSELHGNMYIEVCKHCKQEYWRAFDCTAHTARYSHNTSRLCYQCNRPLVDTIVHFGERGSLQWPLNWAGACKNARQATTILCLGSSLKVLKRYPWLWRMDQPIKKRPNLYIVNLQWTPKDDVANVKVNGKCDEVMRAIMATLGICVGPYERRSDPIFTHCTPLAVAELHTNTQPELVRSDDDDDDDDSNGEKKFIKQEKNVQINKQDCPVNNNFSETCDRTIDGSSSASSATAAVINCKSLPLNVPSTFTSPNCSAFSIDNLLNSPSPNPIFTHHAFSPGNLLIQQYNQMITNSGVGAAYEGGGFTLAGNINYPDFLFYPYQTSFLYPGLHNIISPSATTTISTTTTTSSDINKSMLEPQKLYHEGGKGNAEKKMIPPACEHCDQNYDSPVCLFYQKMEPVFVCPKLRYSKIECKNKETVCLCCDYSTDEDDFENNGNTITTAAGATPTTVSREISEKNNVQAGWFGKGYKKGRRFKRK